MDRTLATLDAQFDTLDAHVEGVGNVEVAGRPAGTVRSTTGGFGWTTPPQVTPLIENEVGLVLVPL